MKRNLLLSKRNITKKSIGVAGVSRKSGVTHLCLCVAGFIASVLRDKVVYVEFAKVSALLPMVGACEVKIDDISCYRYKGVNYVLTDDVNEVEKLFSNRDIWLIIDFEEINDSTAQLYNLCNKKILIGSTKPWCVKEYYAYIYNKKMIINDIGHVACYTIGTMKNEKNDELMIPNIKNGIKIKHIPIIEDPFALEEGEFENLLRIIK